MKRHDAVGFAILLLVCIAAAQVSATRQYPPAVHTLAFDVLGTGAHRQVVLHMPSAEQACPESRTAASLCMKLQLPAALYFDPYELDRVLPQEGGAALTRTAVDLEMPEAAAIESSALVKFHLRDVPSIAKIPVHNKYATPSLHHETKGQHVLIQNPKVAFQCSPQPECKELVDEDGILLEFTSLKAWTIPVESITAIHQVASITQLLQCACTVVIVVLCAWRKLIA